MTEQKVVNFPAGRRRASSAKAGDEKLADDIHKAWRKLWRVIDEAHRAGLSVGHQMNRHDVPKITRTFKA